MTLSRGSIIENGLYDQVYVSALEIDGVMYHAREIGGEMKVVVYADTRQPIPVWVCICNAHNAENCCCGAWEFHLNRLRGIHEQEESD